MVYLNIEYGSGHESVVVLLPGFAIKWSNSLALNRLQAIIWSTVMTGLV